MAKCEVCENDYDKAFEVVASGKSHVFDSFECAILLMLFSVGPLAIKSFNRLRSFKSPIEGRTRIG
jgi:hypothetical protein